GVHAGGTYGKANVFDDNPVTAAAAVHRALMQRDFDAMEVMSIEEGKSYVQLIQLWSISSF
ncbi:hypothetical protein U1Q18_000344, partial [Sarracenia purpurea var. burkii]